MTPMRRGVLFTEAGVSKALLSRLRKEWAEEALGGQCEKRNPQSTTLVLSVVKGYQSGQLHH
jgi:hypothetical protein